MTSSDSIPRSEQAAPAFVGQPFRQFVLKVHSRCDLACDHCYMYEHADQTWRTRPILMANSTVRAAAARIAEHARRHRLAAVVVVLHGGEPLLLGPDRMRSVLLALHRMITPVCRLDLRMQTNGVRLDQAMCEVLLDYGVRVGVSLDGNQRANDRHRRFRGGASSYRQAREALELLRTPRYRELYAGILCTVDLANDPAEVYLALRAERPPRVDLLLPHATWENPPPGSANGTPHADWLAVIYQRWLADGRPMRIRLFDSLISAARDGSSGTEAIGVDTGDLVVVETDGAWELADWMKTAYHGAAATGRSVFQDPADELLTLPGIRARQVGLAALCATCRRCPVVRQCGGGLVAHRYRANTGFDNPSVYCADLKKLVDMVTPPAAVPSAATSPQHGYLDQLASGSGDEECVGWLMDTQAAITASLVRAVAAVADDSVGGRVAKAAWPVLVELDRRDRTTTRRVLSHPFVRAWAVRCLAAPADPGVDFARLAEVTAAAAVCAGPPAELLLRPTRSAIHLPTVGTVTVPCEAPPVVTFAATVGGFHLRWPGGEMSIDWAHPAGSAGFVPTRRLRFGAAEVLFEDGDPYRDCHNWPLAPSGSGPDDGWLTVMAQAWQYVRRDAPAYRPGLERGLRAVVPLLADQAGMMRSGTARHAGGALGFSYTANPAALAVLLVHEFQHTKLGAVLDLHDLFAPDDRRLFTVPWRPDPRPLEAVFQGVYAFLAVADVWRVRRDQGVADAAAHFQKFRGWTGAGVRTLRDSGTLTQAGRRFADGLAQAMDGWPA